MTVQEQVRKDMIDAMKSKNTDKADLLKVLIGEFNRFDKELSDEKALKEIKKMFENAKQMGNSFEMEILDRYLPKMLDEEEVKQIVSDVIKTNNASSMKDMGMVMGTLKKHPKSAQIDMKMANNIVKTIL